MEFSIMRTEKFIVITPARDEASYIGRTIESIVSQTVLPAEWVIVDDGSSDDTAAIAERASLTHPWIKVLRREDRGFRNNEIGAREAFYYALKHITN